MIYVILCRVFIFSLISSKSLYLAPTDTPDIGEKYPGLFLLKVDKKYLSQIVLISNSLNFFLKILKL